ncbi:RsfA family transcriptional regulator [Oceanobacillus halotolerans]|uniref:RsfA family transcriptional regulator n=1 Tax=Oceanobacillus halotolerans TaxID=2663380 RepID=UPI0013DCB77C|nr:RsfA family transcriptional regulator [Oceanobacillus halotolerans]
MDATRQDAWTKDEDIMLAETVLRYIREGKTQLEAFKEVARKLSRTPAACGFRWNATIRKDYQDAIELAKEERKKGGRSYIHDMTFHNGTHQDDPIETAISLLEKMKTDFNNGSQISKQEQEEIIRHLQKENEMLKEQLNQYKQAWEEMGKLWNWVSAKQQGQA